MKLFNTLFFILLTINFIPVQAAIHNSSQQIKEAANKNVQEINTKTLKPFSEMFSELLVLDQGRYKPIDTYARTKLIQFSGRTSIKVEKYLQRENKKNPAKTINLNYQEWFTLAIFKPEAIYSAKVFLINNPEVLTAINVKPESHRRYSYDDLRGGVSALNDLANQAESKPDGQRSLVDKEFIRVSNNFHEFTQITNSLSLFQKKPMFQNIAVFYSWIGTYKEYLNAFRREETFAIIPNFQTQLQNKSALEFLNPWTYFFELGSLNAEPKSIEALKQCLSLQKSFDDNNFDEFRKNIHSLNQASFQHIKALNKSVPKLDLEILYNHLNPLNQAQLLYCLALIILSIGSVFSILRSKFALSKIAFTVFLAAFALHLFAIILRILILERAPVSNLYETFVFVSFITAFLGLILNLVGKAFSPAAELSQCAHDEKATLVLSVSSFSAFMLLLISSKFVTDGDSMKVLIAVLDSNFWLSTHVIAEMIGYAGVSLAGLIGHIYLVKDLLRDFSIKRQLQIGDINLEIACDEELVFLNKIILGMIGFGLCFTFLGTMLGGVWADQSWGRFWGWDPKENGALLILLWTAITLHARLAGYIKNFGVAIFSIIGTMVVMLSWFGVNLLGVGLHSYGFTQGLMTNLLSYLGLEILFIGVAIGLKLFKERIVIK